MINVCPHCNAQKWKKESLTLCCSNGKVKLPLIKESPLILKTLLEENTSNHFRSNINKYNSAFQMTSFRTEHNLPIMDSSPHSKFKANAITKLEDYYQFWMKNQSSFKCISREIHRKKPSNETDMLVETLK